MPIAAWLQHWRGQTDGRPCAVRAICHSYGGRGGDNGEDGLLASCYRNSCELASAQPAIRTLVFPCISTGNYGFPFERAARIAIRECTAYTDRLAITFCCFSDCERNLYDQWLVQH